jgi:hypothetical protein
MRQKLPTETGTDADTCSPGNAMKQKVSAIGV